MPVNNHAMGIHSPDQAEPVLTSCPRLSSCLDFLDLRKPRLCRVLGVCFPHGSSGCLVGVLISSV